MVAALLFWHTTDLLHLWNYTRAVDRQLELRMKYWEIIADNLSKAGLSWGCVSAIDSNGRTIWIADAHRDGKRFVVRGDVLLTAFVELRRAIHEFAVSLIL